MKLLLALMLSAWLCADLGEGQQNLDCNQCKFKWNSYCLYTGSSTVTCNKNEFYCGITKVSIGNITAFSMVGCIQQNDCNRPLIDQSPAKFLSYNTSCCVEHFCNSSPHLTASLLSASAALGLFLLV